MRYRSFRLGTLLVICGLAKSSLGRELAVELEWNGPLECEDDGSVAREIERILGDSEVNQSEPTFVTADVTRTPEGRWLVSLRTESGGQAGERSLLGASCNEVRRATALIVALMIDPDVQLATPSKPEATDQADSPRSIAPSRPPEPRRTTPSPSAEPTREHEWLLALDALAGTGTLPALSFGARFALGLKLERLSLELSGSAWLPQREVSDPERQAGGEFELWGGSFVLCYELLPLRAALGACVGSGARSMRGEGFGVSEPSSARATWAVAIARGFARYELSDSWALRSTFAAEFPFRAPTFSLAGLGPVHSPSSLALELGLGAEIHF